ncbi:unnamed protein product [Ilex paraguariensis]|uniref:Uncharacterized protein n=1 Tax=Ilex paraguariensis TaxID=185542 RepID=A0ABC8TQY4_9AQUA
MIKQKRNENGVKREKVKISSRTSSKRPDAKSGMPVASGKSMSDGHARDRQASGSSDVSSGRLGGMLDDTNGLPNKCGRQVSTTCIGKTIGSMPDADPDNIQNLLEFAM